MKILTILEHTMEADAGITEPMIIESFADATRVFVRQGAEPEAVKSTIQRYTELRDRNLLSGNERDITTWVRSGWESFSAFVGEKESQPSKRQNKRDIKSDGSISLGNVNGFKLIVPLTGQAAQLYGKGTKWCITNPDTFYDMFIMRYIFVYFLGKAKIAVQYDMADDKIYGFTAEDEEMTPEEVARITGVDAARLFELLEPHLDAIDTAIDEIPEF